MHKDILLTPKIEAFNLKGVNPPVTFLLVKSSKRRGNSKFSARISFHNMEKYVFFLSVIVTDILGFY